MQKFNSSRKRLGPTADPTARILAGLTVGLLLFAGANTSFAAQINAGDLIVVDYHHLTVGGGVVVDINPLTGAQTLISSGQNLTEPTDVCFDGAGNIIVADYGYNDSGRIVSIDPATGQQTLISMGGILSHPVAVAVDAQGRIVVAQQGQNQAVGAVLRINPLTGNQTQVTSGQNLAAPTGLAFDANGDYLISNFQNASSIVKVSANTAHNPLYPQAVIFRTGPKGFVWILWMAKAHWSPNLRLTIRQTTS